MNIRVITSTFILTPQEFNMNFIDQVYSFGKSIVNQAKEGFPLSSEKTVIDRVEICNSCDLLDKVNFKCNSCGCYLKYKIAWATSECPLNPPKWSKEK